MSEHGEAAENGRHRFDGVGEAQDDHAVMGADVKIPFLSMLIGLAAYPVLAFAPFDASGPHAQYGFAWIDIISPPLWAILIAYFTVIYFVPLYLWKRRKGRS